MNLMDNDLVYVKMCYYYRVQECGIRKTADGKFLTCYRTDLDFKCDDLLESRAAAEYWYLKKSQENHTAESITLNLCEQYGDTNLYEEFVLLGEDEETNAEGRQYESEVLGQLGIKLEAKYQK